MVSTGLTTQVAWEYLPSSFSFTSFLVISSCGTDMAKGYNGSELRGRL